MRPIRKRKPQTSVCDAFRDLHEHVFQVDLTTNATIHLVAAPGPDRSEPLYLYCGGGFRSALSADNLQKMGYTNVVNVDGGWRALKDLMPTESASHPFA